MYAAIRAEGGSCKGMHRCSQGSGTAWQHSARIILLAHCLCSVTVMHHSDVTSHASVRMQVPDLLWALCLRRGSLL